MVDLRGRIARGVEGVEGVEPGESMFGHGEAYWANGTEIAHFEGDGLIEIRLTRAVIRDNRATLKGDARVELRRHTSDWITLRYAFASDAEFVVALVTRAAEAHRPPPGVAPKPPPTGADLARRKRFH